VRCLLDFPGLSSISNIVCAPGYPGSSVTVIPLSFQRDRRGAGVLPPGQRRQFQHEFGGAMEWGKSDNILHEQDAAQCNDLGR
jgi:hypothetical protein